MGLKSSLKELVLQNGKLVFIVFYLFELYLFIWLDPSFFQIFI